ncbi:hypothetical protein D3C87_1076710 [compost metagenome]
MRSRRKESYAGIKLTITLLICAAALISKAGYTNPSAATKLLMEEGYTDIQIKGRTFFGCGNMEFWRTRFEAKNSRGIRAHGVVCKGLTSDAVIHRG